MLYLIHQCISTSSCFFLWIRGCLDELQGRKVKIKKYINSSLWFNSITKYWTVHVQLNRVKCWKDYHLYFFCNSGLWQASHICYVITNVKICPLLVWKQVGVTTVGVTYLIQAEDWLASILVLFLEDVCKHRSKQYYTNCIKRTRNI